MKFPRTPHLPGSKATPDDLHADYTYDGPVVVTEKMDGSNIMMNQEKFITRKGSTSTADWTYPVRNFHYAVAQSIPKGIWIAGEFLYWRKAIGYDNLESPFLMFGAMKGNKCLSWTEVENLSAVTGIPTVRIIARGVLASDGISQGRNFLHAQGESTEGFVIRPTDSFQLPHYGEFVAKFVGPHHNPIAANNGINGFLN